MHVAVELHQEPIPDSSHVLIEGRPGTHRKVRIPGKDIEPTRRLGNPLTVMLQGGQESKESPQALKLFQPFGEVQSAVPRHIAPTGSTEPAAPLEIPQYVPGIEARVHLMGERLNRGPTAQRQRPRTSPRVKIRGIREPKRQDVRGRTRLSGEGRLP